MLHRYIFPVILCLCTLGSLHAAKVDTVVTYSAAMRKEIKAIVVTPDGYANDGKYPAVYLLHGHGDSYASGWMAKGKGFETLADLYRMIIVCPDGGGSRWYFDSPIDAGFRYETYIVGELVPWIDRHYRTVASREGRGITGLSMGGHGALYLAFRHQDVFGAAGSMSGGVDIRPFPNNWDIAKRLGTYAQYPENWEKNTVINMLHLLAPGSLALIIDCGSDDFFYKVNCELHRELLYRNIPHEFTSRPGAHSWTYWKNAGRYQILFMSDFFSKQPSGKK